MDYVEMDYARVPGLPRGSGRGSRGVMVGLRSGLDADEDEAVRN